MTNPLFVGIDIHRQANRVCLLDREGQRWGPGFSTTNNRPGTQTLIAHLVQALRRGAFDSLWLAVEATNWYWFPLFQTLAQDPLLNRWPVQLFTYNPRLIAHYKKSEGDRDKTDDGDALAAADRLRTARCRPAPFQPDNAYLGLRFLTRYRYHLVKDLVREKNYALNLLFLKLTGYGPGQPFADVFGATSRAVLTEFAASETIAALPLETLVAWVARKGRGGFVDPGQVAQELQQLSQDSYPLAAALQASVNAVLHWNLQLIKDLERQIEHLNQAIAQTMAAIPQTLDTIPGFGPVFSAGIIAEIGHAERFAHDEAKVAQYAGLHWRQHESGKFKAEDTYLTRQGNSYLRYYFCEAANKVRMHDADYAAYYQRKCAEVRTHQHKRALVLTARKLVRLVVRLLTTNQAYQPRRQPAA